MTKFAEIPVINPVPCRWSLSLACRRHCLMKDEENISETSHFRTEFARIIILSLLESVEYLIITSMVIK
jgi:hypothetical protein